MGRACRPDHALRVRRRRDLSIPIPGTSWTVHRLSKRVAPSSGTSAPRQLLPPKMPGTRTVEGRRSRRDRGRHRGCRGTSSPASAVGRLASSRRSANGRCCVICGVVVDVPDARRGYGAVHRLACHHRRGARRPGASNGRARHRRRESLVGKVGAYGQTRPDREVRREMVVGPRPGVFRSGTRGSDREAESGWLRCRARLRRSAPTAGRKS